MTRRGLRRALLLAVVVLAAALAAAVYYHYDPSQVRLFPRCVFLELTGYRCPGCGSQRALHALLHGHVGMAVRYNAAWLAGVPLVVLFVVAEAGRSRWPRFHRAVTGSATLLTVAAALLAWWLLRNLFGL